MKKTLIYRFLNREHSIDELREIHKKVNLNDEAFLETIEEDWNNFELREDRTWPEENWDRIQNAIALVSTEDTSDKVFRLHWWIKIAATVIVIATVWFAFRAEESQYTEESESPKMIVEANDSDQSVEVLLKDGTIVTLMAYSSLSYYENFNSKYRVVHLEGEALFETDENNTRPFVVISDNITSICRGREFSISAFKESEEINVVLASGQIEISQNNKLNSENNKIAVKSCQKYSFNKTNDKYLIGQISDCENNREVRSMKEASSDNIAML